MKVEANAVPQTVCVETYGPQPGMVEVRLRENVVKTEDGFYAYDEYRFHLPDQPGLKDHIQENLADWLAAGRILGIGVSLTGVGR